MELVKIKNGVATREPLPDALVGLLPESLSDLSWTDPSIKLRDSAWWPVKDMSPALGQNQVYGAETLTVDMARRIVTSVRAVIDLPPPVPSEVTRRQGLQALFLRKQITEAMVEAKIKEVVTEPAAQYLALTEFRASQVFERDRPLVNSVGAAFGLDLDDLFIFAKTL